jgi:DNA-binding transcriptional LysR family regulator
MLERVHLVVVRAVEKCGSLTAAAEVLCLTQSALSHSIKKLEAQLDRLFSPQTSIAVWQTLLEPR